MTREEQIDWLCRLRAYLNNGIIFTPWNKEFTEVLNSVLEQEPKTEVLDKIRDEIKSLSNANPSYWHSGNMVDRDDVFDIIDKYKTESEG